MHVGNGHNLGQKSGEETVTLSAAEMPSHDHTLQANSADANSADPTGHVLSRSTTPEGYHAAATMTAMEAGSVTNVGGGQAHENMQPFLAINFCIALRGLFPSRN